jgi:CTP synthase
MLNKNVAEIKYIFVTGGVVSGIGKGICAASIGYLLKSAGYSVGALKMDPYLNIDPGTMSPFEHGEVFVLEDGKETDLDLGNYERFLNMNLDKNSSSSAGSIYTEIFNKERKGDFLGKTVQIIPHLTDLIQEKFGFSNQDIQVKIIEIGGSTGDIEAEIFLESLRQFKAKNKYVLHFHLGYVPFLKVVGEYKSKPLQNSIKELLRLGLQPDVIVLRFEQIENQIFSKTLKDKIALHCNLEFGKILELPDFKSIYSAPKYLLENTNILQILSKFMGSKTKPVLNKFFNSNEQIFEKTVKIALIGKYSGLNDAYLSVIESLKIASHYNQTNIIIQVVDAEDKELLIKMQEFDGFIIPGGFGKRGMEEKIQAIEYIRCNRKPFLGICLGLQIAVIEFLRNTCQKTKAISREMLEERGKQDIEKNCDICIDYMPEQYKEIVKGGTMRLGVYDCEIKQNTLAAQIFKQSKIFERHRHRLEVQQQFVELLEKNGMIVSGKHFIKNSLNNSFLVEIIELEKKSHPFFIATQSHPEFLSRPNKPHPLFDGFIKSIVDI